MRIVSFASTVRTAGFLICLAALRARARSFIASRCVWQYGDLSSLDSLFAFGLAGAAGAPQMMQRPSARYRFCVTR
jgi:hypothetical protein